MSDDRPVVVLGGSVAGLWTALFLARHGRSSIVLDRDPTTADVDPPGPDAEPRRTTRQAAHSHIFVAALRRLLAARAPDVLEALLAAGVEELPLRDGRPPGLADADDPAFDDPELVALVARRTTLEQALRSAMAGEPSVDLRAGTVADGLVLTDDRPPTVIGVHLEDGTTIDAALVVDATGRRTPVPGWLEGRAEPQLDVEECGIAYLTRFYRLLPGVDRPPLNRGFTAGASFDRYSCLVFPGDHRTFSVTFGVLPEDRSLRGLNEVEAFDAATAAIGMISPWTDPAVAEPISDVASMTGLKNRIRRWTTADGPQVLGLVAVGDSTATSNPAHSRGTTLAALHAAAVADAVADEPDLDALARRVDAELLDGQGPWVADSVQQDAARLSRWRDGAPPAPPPTDERLTNGELYGAAVRDPRAWRAFTRLQNVLDRPDDVLADPALVRHVRSLPAPPTPTPTPASSADSTSPPAPAAPSHDELAALVAAATHGHPRRRGLVAAGS